MLVAVYRLPTLAAQHSTSSQNYKKIRSKEEKIFYYFQLWISALKAIIRLNTRTKENVHTRYVIWVNTTRMKEPWEWNLYNYVL
jgi:hypothetical protein